MAVAPCKYDVPHNGLKYLDYYPAHKVFHPGADLNAGTGNQDLGNTVVAPIDGEVEYVSPLGRSNGGFGNFIILYHPQYGIWTRYAHLRNFNVKVGERVNENEKIAEVGSSGTTYAHLHFEVFNDKCFELQKAHWRKFAYYPSNKSRQWVQEHYLDPLAFIDSVNTEEGETAREWCRKNLPQADWKGVSEGEAERFRSLAKQIKKWFV